MKGVLALGCILGLLAAPGFAGDKIYTWVDDKGVTHYGEQPPKNVTATLVHARTGHSDPTPLAEPQQKQSTGDMQAEQPTVTKDPDRCKAARENLNTLNSNSRIKMADKDGNLRYLTEEEKKQQYDQMNKAVEESCD